MGVEDLGTVMRVSGWWRGAWGCTREISLFDSVASMGISAGKMLLTICLEEEKWFE